jgi:citrate synthase
MDRTIHPPEGYLAAQRAAALLGVKLPTLYAYASRGLVRSVPGAGPKARWYARSDLERLRARSGARAGHGPVAAGALRWGEPVLDSAVSSIDGDGPRYRGLLATDLARERRPFEEVAELLWTGHRPESCPIWTAAWPGSPAGLAALLPEGSAPLCGPALALPFLSAADPDRLGAAREAELSRARRLLTLLGASFALPLGPERIPRALAQPRLARVLAVALGVPGPKSWVALETALIFCADHELNASTFAARIAASAGADLYACVTAALATLSGPRHGGLGDQVEALLDEVGSADRAARVVRERHRRGEALPGFGHRLYPGGDPRAEPLLALARGWTPVRPRTRTLLAVVEVMRQLGGERPSLDLGLVAVSAALALPRGSGVALFALGRAAGWIAHILEQREDPNLLRPRARYVG